MTKNISALPLPRTIDPSLIEIGDTIQVNLPKDRGIETKIIGTVHHRSDHGRTRYLYTEEGATILAWEPKTNRKVHILLLHRPEVEQKPLGFFDEPEIMERIAG